MAPVVKELEKHPDQIISRVCVTAQHREMLDQVLALFAIVPDYDLNLMRPGQTLSGLTARVFTDLAPVIAQEQPDWVLVQGDTTTVMAASLVNHRTVVPRARKLLDDFAVYSSRARAVNPYGDGKAAGKIAKLLLI